MLKQDYLRHSPIRVLEKSISGGLGNGHLGVFTARKGVGKTASLVHMATDKLLQGKRVFHVSFADDPAHIDNWYRQVFRELSNTYKFESPAEIYEELKSKRFILHYRQTDVQFSKIRGDILQICQSMDFCPQTIIVDGFQFDRATIDELAQWKKLAEEREIEIWFSATLHRENLNLDERGVPAPVNRFYDAFSVVIWLQPEGEQVDFRLLKNHETLKTQDLLLKLDPKTLLISNRRA